uniref:Uncharacterized protein n=1 Tax=Chromulina nebulosa TaxID=96789 RepID=A0A7S0SX08_9STRA|mmetsp:Transcript_4472/g.4009  ORF Transcript_4472/g.4009 Transcript_4472/m.4009 type:complete len:175 (+) Transcript_4472:72-596(+)
MLDDTIINTSNVNSYEVNTVETFFQSYELCCGDLEASYGYFKQKNLNEQGRTAILSLNMPHIPDYKNIDFIYMHQSYLLVNDEKCIDGTVDMSLYAKENKNLTPLIIWEMSDRDLYKKFYQVINIANSMILYQMPDEFTKWPLIGVIYDYRHFEVHVYFQYQGKLVDIILIELR